MTPRQKKNKKLLTVDDAVIHEDGLDATASHGELLRPLPPAVNVGHVLINAVTVSLHLWGIAANQEEAVTKGHGCCVIGPHRKGWTNLKWQVVRDGSAQQPLTYY